MFGLKTFWPPFVADHYARQQNASRVLAMTLASVRPSVRHALELYQIDAQ